MKKIIIAFAVLSIFLCGCKNDEILPKTSGISFDADISYGDKQYPVSAKIYEGGISVFTVNDGTLKDMTVTFDGEDVTIDYLGLSYKPKLPFPTENITQILESIARSASNESKAKLNGEQYELSGKAGKYNYVIILSEAGLPLSFKCDDADLSAQFTNVTIIE